MLNHYHLRPQPAAIRRKRNTNPGEMLPLAKMLIGRHATSFPTRGLRRDSARREDSRGKREKRTRAAAAEFDALSK
ncbi:hypothetical protein MTP99_016746 [Tenebrio molitor]|nr:hypothetical protein MTP99_016746 [Tenebrio molitor]